MQTFYIVIILHFIAEGRGRWTYNIISNN